MLIFAKSAYDAAKYFKTDYETIIVYATVGFILYGAGSPVAAILADKFSRVLLLFIFPLGVGVSSIVASLSRTPFELGIAIAFIGLFSSIYHPVGIAMLVKKTIARGLRLGINGVWGNMGVAAAPLITGGLILVGDWRLAFLCCGILCLIYAVIFFLAINTGTEITETKVSQSENQLSPKWLQVLLGLSFITISGGCTFGLITFLLPRYFEVYMSLVSNNVAITGLLAALVFMFASFSQLLVGWIVDRYSARTILCIVAIGQILTLNQVSRLEGMPLFFLMVVAMGFVLGQVPISDAILARYIPDKHRSRVLSFKVLLNLCVGAAVLPITSYLLKSGSSLNTLFLFLSVVPILVLFGTFLLPKASNPT